MRAIVCIFTVMSGIEAYAQSIVPQKDEKKDLWGYVSKSTGKWVVKPKFDEATELNESPNGQLRGTVSQKGKKGLIDDSGKIIGAGVAFEEITPMQGDAMFIKVKGKTGVADYNGNYIVKPEVDNVEQLGEEGWIITIKGKKGILKNDGDFLLQPVYTDIDVSVPGYYIIKSGDKAGLLKRDGTSLVLPKDFTGLKPYKDNYWVIEKKGKRGMIDVSNGNVLIKPDYDEVIGMYLNGKAIIVKKGKKIQILDEFGKKTDYLYSSKIEVLDDPDKNALYIVTAGGDMWLYLNKSKKAFPILIETSKFHQFEKNMITLRKDYPYSAQDVEDLKPFTEIGNEYISRDGKTKYTSGKDLTPSLYLMDEKDLYRVGDDKKIGVIDKDKDYNNDFINLESGEVVDENGDLYEFLTYNRNTHGKLLRVFGVKNLKTGKCSVVYNYHKVNNKLYDDLIGVIAGGEWDSFNKMRSDGLIGRIGEQFYRLNLNGDSISVLSKGSIVEIEDGAVFNTDGKYGIKSNGKIILPMMYDFVYPSKVYDRDKGSMSTSKYWIVKNDTILGLFDPAKEQMLIPLEKGYTDISGNSWGYSYTLSELYDSDLYCVYTGNRNNNAVDVWNLKLGKEVLQPSVENKISTLPKGYKGYRNNGVAYTPAGSKMQPSPCIDVIASGYNPWPIFSVVETGLEGRTIQYYITVYTDKGTIYKNDLGKNCIYKCETSTPSSQIVDIGMHAYVADDIYLTPYSKKTLKFVLSAKDANTGASIPIKGKKTFSAVFSRKRNKVEIHSL